MDHRSRNAAAPLQNQDAFSNSNNYSNDNGDSGMSKIPVPSKIPRHSRALTLGRMDNPYLQQQNSSFSQSNSPLPSPSQDPRRKSLALPKISNNANQAPPSPSSVSPTHGGVDRVNTPGRLRAFFDEVKRSRSIGDPVSVPQKYKDMLAEDKSRVIKTDSISRNLLSDNTTFTISRRQTEDISSTMIRNNRNSIVNARENMEDQVLADKARTFPRGSRKSAGIVLPSADDFVTPEMEGTSSWSEPVPADDPNLQRRSSTLPRRTSTIPPPINHHPQHNMDEDIEEEPIQEESLEEENVNTNRLSEKMDKKMVLKHLSERKPPVVAIRREESFPRTDEEQGQDEKEEETEEPQATRHVSIKNPPTQKSRQHHQQNIVEDQEEEEEEQAQIPIVRKPAIIKPPQSNNSDKQSIKPQQVPQPKKPGPISQKPARPAEPNEQPKPRAPTPNGMSRCEYCERCFNDDRVEKHMGVCQKNPAKQQRKVMDGTSLRTKGTEFEKSMKKSQQSGKSSVTMKKPVPPGGKDWRAQHEQLMNVIRASRETS